MQVVILPVLLLLSSSLLFSNVGCEPNHHHNHHDDFPWQNILSSLGIVIENKTNVISSTEANGDGTTRNKDHYSSESTVGILNSGTTEGIETPLVIQNGTIYTSSSDSGLAYKISIPIVGIIFFVLFWYFICKCCCACCQRETPGVVVMQSNPVQPQQPAPAPQIILQQPIVHQHAAPMYDNTQRWAQPPQGHPQWGKPPQQQQQWEQPPHEPPQWAPHPMGQQQHYSPSGGYEGYDNPNFNHPTAPPPYNTQKY